MTTGINTLAYNHVRTILRRLSRSRNISDLHKHSRRDLKTLKRLDNATVGLNLLLRSKQPDPGWRMLLDDGQDCL